MTLLNMKLTLKNLESWLLKRSVLSDPLKSEHDGSLYWQVGERAEQSTTSDALGAYMETHM